MTRTPKSSSRFRIWVGDSSRSKMARSSSSRFTRSAASSAMPEPRQVAVSGAGRFWVRKKAGSAPAVRVSSASSSREAWGVIFPGVQGHQQGLFRAGLVFKQGYLPSHKKIPPL